MQDTKNAKPRGLRLRGGIWWIDKRLTVGGRSIKLLESTGERTLEAAARIFYERVATVSRQSLGAVDPHQARERTFAEAAVEYILALEDRGKDTKRAELDLRMLDAAIGALPLSHVCQQTLRPWIQSQRGSIKSGTVARALRTAAAVLHYAAQVLRDGHDPWLQGAVPRLIAPDWGDTRQPRPITWEEQDRLIAELPAHLVAPVLLAASTGARAREIESLRWDQHRCFDGIPQWGAWWIPPEVRKHNARKRLGQQEGRYLVCNAMARSVIAGQQGRGTVWVFPSPRAGGTQEQPVERPLDRLSNHGWVAARHRAGLDIRIHDLRHTFGERLATVGVPFDARKTILGHDHADITAHYSTPGLTRLIAEVERVVRPAPRRAVSEIVRQSA